MLCGLTASTTISGVSRTSWLDATECRPPFFGRSASTGSATIASPAARPRDNHPSSIAPPIFPQPTSRSLAMAQRPLNLAGRFSRKAAAPSLRSSLVAIFSSL